MKSILRAALPVAGLVLWAGTATAQLEANLGALEDENAVGYLSPLSTALSATLNSSIFKTGRVPQSGFSVHLTANVMGVSFDDEDRTYTPSDPAGFESAEDVQAPTVIGDLGSVTQQGQAGTVLYHPGGFDVDNFTVAVPQLEIGGFAGTRALVRWISIDLGDTDLGELELFGVGVQHSLSQYFVDLPFDLAVGGFFQQFSIGGDLLDTQMFQIMATGSRQYGVLEPYLGLGFDAFDMKAEYTEDGTDTKIEADFDPENNLHLTAGALLNLQYVQIHGEFNLAAETGVAVGLSLGY